MPRWERSGARRSARPGIRSIGAAPVITRRDNDGVVTVDSARFGEFRDAPWRCDHVDMVGHNLDTADLGRFQFDHLAAIGAIIATS